MNKIDKILDKLIIKDLTELGKSEIEIIGLQSVYSQDNATILINIYNEEDQLIKSYCNLLEDRDIKSKIITVYNELLILINDMHSLKLIELALSITGFTLISNRVHSSDSQ